LFLIPPSTITIYERHRSFHFSRAVSSAHSFFCSRCGKNHLAQFLNCSVSEMFPNIDIVYVVDAGAYEDAAEYKDTGAYEDAAASKDTGAHKCPKCNKSYTRKASLYVHVNLDCGRGAFVCSHCDYRSTRKCNLKRHLYAVHKIVSNHEQYMSREDF
jgi:hypothetical protein